MPLSRRFFGGTRTTGSGAKRAARPNPAPTRPTPSKREGGPDEKNTRIAGLHLGHPRDGYRYVSFLHAPFPRRTDFSPCHCRARSASILELQISLLRAPVHHSIPRLLDRAFRPLHLYFESPPDLLARTPSQVSRSQ